MSVGNDGAVKMRTLEGAVQYTFLNPVDAEGKPSSVFRVSVGVGGAVMTANEDQTVRIYKLDGSVASLSVSGTCRVGQPAYRAPLCCVG
ncbi:hypothetical protein EON66_01890 [archaeon]|nr:MAG: hypothetical protein EON66_01890 [archaeon]